MREELKCPILHFLPLPLNHFVFCVCLLWVMFVMHLLWCSIFNSHWPQTKLTWIVGKTEMGLLSGIEGVELVPYDKKSGWKGVWNLWMFLKNNQFDALLNMQTAFRASIISLGIQAKYKIGFGKKRSREGQWLFVNRRVQDPETPHVLDGFMAFADYLGVPPAEMLSWQLAISDADREYAKQFIDPMRKNLIISPCSSKAEKDWLVERYAEVANIAHQHNVNVIFCSSPAKRELEMVKKITALCDFQPVDASGKTSLKQLAALIHQANLVISPDSGPSSYRDHARNTGYWIVCLS